MAIYELIDIYYIIIFPLCVNTHSQAVILQRDFTQTHYKESLTGYDRFLYDLLKQTWTSVRRWAIPLPCLMKHVLEHR